MCITFTCTCCNCTFVDHCEDKPSESELVTNPDFDSPTTAAKKALAATLSNQREVCPGPIWITEPTKCETCIRVKGAIRKLEDIIYQAPFLGTEGLAGLENMSCWERESMECLLRGRKKGWEDQAESRAERHEIQTRIAEMGLDAADDGRKEHQGWYTMITPPKSGQKIKETAEPSGGDFSEEW